MDVLKYPVTLEIKTIMMITRAQCTNCVEFDDQIEYATRSFISETQE